MGFADDMEGFDQEFEDAKDKPRPAGVGGPMLKDGRHQAIIAEARIEHDSTEDRYSMVWLFRNKKGSVRKFFNLDHEVGREIAAQDSALCGYEGKLSGLEKACEDEFFIGLLCEIGVRTKPGTDRDYTNVYVNRCLGQADLDDYVVEDGAEGAEPVGAAPASVIPDDDIPF